MNEPSVCAALVKAQEEFPAIAKDRNVTVQTRTGGSYTFGYATLDGIMAKVRPVLTKNGLALTQTFGVAPSGGPVLTTSLVHADGGSISGDLPLPVQPGQSAQELGSLITYCRRYAIVAILGLATEEDDDANHAAGNTVQASRGGSQNGAQAAEKAPDPHGLQQSRADAVQPGQVIVPFGKHKGKTVAEVPRDYWDWWLAQDGRKDEKVLAAVELHLGLELAATGGDPVDDDLPF